MSRSTTTSGTGASVGSNILLAHPDEASCIICKYWIASKAYDLHTAGRRMIDAGRIVARTIERRSHGIPSEAHFHSRGLSCEARCIA